MNTRVRDLFVVPDHLKKGDFVVKLGEGIEHPRETADTYVPTPALVDAFDRALKLVGSALADARSQAAYLHGSFGSGKSHFMALLSLMLSNHEEAWRLPELHGLREKHPFLASAKLLRLHFHMVGQDSLEAAVFSRYIEHVRAEHPGADLPGLFADEQLFEDARRMLEELGEAAFFAPMNAASAAGGWGKVAVRDAWNRARFERLAASDKAEERAELFTALARTRFSAAAQAQGAKAFVSLDAGLATMARHAAGLGYGGVVLFLDELILWLASRASDSAWLHNEVQKMVKLVEAQEMRRAIPIISFIARQRDLASMVGDSYAGAENVRLRDSLRYWADRYGTVELEDRNLPAIVEKRVLRPKDDAARAALDEAFERMRRAAGGAWQTMLGQQDGAAFRKLYPFSPALVEALVALSNSLQRERTAIKLLTEILVEHIQDLEVGEVLRVGDLFDLLAGGDDTADGVMRARFEAAKHLYRYQLLPLIQQTHGTNSEARCQRLRPGHPTRIGCSNCAEKACRSDNRVAKTLLIAALVPEVPALKEMTASRLVQLNYGTLKAPIAGTEATLVGQKLRNWASAIGQLHVGDQGDPTVRLVLEGVDLAPIMKLAAEHDTAGARQRVTRDLLFDAMGVDKVADWGKDHVHKGWRGTDRLGHIRFGNVRKLPPDALRCPEGHDWRIVVDYPFDDPGFGPNDDVEVIDKITEDGAGTWTLVWIPSFFSEPVNKLLGELVVLEHILETTETRRRYTSHLSVEHQSRAILDLENLRNQKRSRILGVIEQVYGLATASEPDIDPARALDKHLYVLKPGATVQPLLAASLATALDGYIPALLEARYPRHPKFTEKLTAKRVERLLTLFGELVDSEEKRVGHDRDTLAEVRGTLGELGLVRVTEAAVHLLEDHTLQALERRRAQKALDDPTAGDVRTWLDEGKRMGLEPDAADLVVRAYARWATRTLVRFDRPYEAKAGTVIPDEVVLEKPELPTQAEWVQALTLAGSTFGLALPGRALHADNLKRFEAALAEKVRATAADAAKLPGLLRHWQAELALPDERTDRMTTAELADVLSASLQGKAGLEQVRALAGFDKQERAKAIGRSLASAADNVRVLEDPLVLGVMRQLDVQGKGAEIRDSLAKVLRQDEVIVALAPRLKQLALEGQRLLVVPPAAPPPAPVPEPPVAPPPPPPTHDRVPMRARGRAVLAVLERALETARERVEAGDEDLDLEGTLTVRKPKG